METRVRFQRTSVQNARWLTKEFVDHFAPAHTSNCCSDENLRNSDSYTEGGYAECVRCALLSAFHQNWLGPSFKFEALSAYDENRRNESRKTENLRYQLRQAEAARY